MFRLYTDDQKTIKRGKEEIKDIIKRGKEEIERHHEGTERRQVITLTHLQSTRQEEKRSVDENSTTMERERKKERGEEDLEGENESHH